MYTRAALCLAAVLAATAAPACSLFHHDTPTPQQQMLDAMKAGNGAKVNHLWLGMSPEDRLKFQQGRGMTSAPPPDEAQQLIMQHEADQIMNGTMSDGETIERPRIDPSQGLEGLQKLAPNSSSTPAAELQGQ
ncbi:MAG TPA: hypothetical protein VEJ86_00215 [Candidatus Binataceae bacterium]|nr:hypothetical protein [Candidatus Binataceae bacterium]